jgi:hypothetical protein
MEAAAIYFLFFAPMAGVPRDPNPWHQAAGTFSALFHAPPLLLNDFMCRKLCLKVPGAIQYADIAVFGYAVNFLFLRFLCSMIFV